MLTQSQKQALDLIAVASVECEQATAVPAELSAAQAILESGWLSRVSRNNCFGIKAHPGAPDRQLLATVEWFTDQECARFLAGATGRTAVLDPTKPTTPQGRRKYDAHDWFAAYPNLTACFTDHARVLRLPIYSDAWRAYEEKHDFAALVRGIAAHYATDPHYAGSVMAVASSPAVAAAVVGVRNNREYEERLTPERTLKGQPKSSTSK